MTTLIRSTKSGSEWTKNELRAYNITVTPQNVAAFFGNATLPQPSVHQVILSNEEYPANGVVDKDDRNFFYLEEAMTIPPGEGSAVDDFAARLLALLGYDVADRFSRQRKDIPLFMCGGTRIPKPMSAWSIETLASFSLCRRTKGTWKKWIPNHSSLWKLSPLFSITIHAYRGLALNPSKQRPFPASP